MAGRPLGVWRSGEGNWTIVPCRGSTEGCCYIDSNYSPVYSVSILDLYSSILYFYIALLLLFAHASYSTIVYAHALDWNEDQDIGTLGDCLITPGCEPQQAR